ncbi:two component transcriptional regulator PhoB, winged helix family [mine drainage metagenome]|uniref:Two component transcriptional regulator PhoB, winged helix family n=2 Tax=mine drainage metagenome TaxID=410659 RepID=T0ZZN5_9ZZZZ
MLSLTLRRAGYYVIVARDVRAAQESMGEGVPDLIILDWMMPTVSGLEYARQLRRDELTRGIPIILLTARDEEDDKLRGFESGVDDFVTKPFSSRELLARVQAVLRRSRLHDQDGCLRLGELTLDLRTCEVFFKEAAIRLGPTEFRLLKYFMSHPNHVHSRSRILDHIWGLGKPIDERTVDVHVGRLRKSLEPFGIDQWIETQRGNGYRLRIPVTTEAGRLSS